MKSDVLLLLIAVFDCGYLSAMLAAKGSMAGAMLAFSVAVIVVIALSECRRD